MKKQPSDTEKEVGLARAIWGPLSEAAENALKQLLNRHSLSVASGDLLYLERRWYVTHSGLLRLSRRKRCVGIQVSPVRAFCDPALTRWTFKATVYRSSNCRGFVGYGDADPSNVSPLVHGAEMRVAETRAVNRALRKAYGSASARSRRSGRARTHPSRLQNRRRCPHKLPTGTTAIGRYAIDSARSFASISSIQTWSRLMRLTSAAPKLCAKPLGNRSRTSSLIWPIGRRRTVMPCSASSTAISARKKVPHETPDHRLARR